MIIQPEEFIPVAGVTLEQYRHELDTKGYCRFPDVVPQELLNRLRLQIDEAIETDLKSDLTRGQYSYLAHNKGDCFITLLEMSPVQEYLDLILGYSCIIHSYNMIRIAPDQNNPVQNSIHRDSQRFCRPYLLSIQILYLIDDFTNENGATYLLAGSHKSASKPTEENFYAKADRVIGKAGDAVIFDSMAWHAGGQNKTKDHRRGITIVYTRPFMKQQIDLPRATKPEILDQLSPRCKRLLGFDARVPASIEEFMLPADQRLYKPNQG